MKKIIIKENEKGLLFKNGKFVKVLSAGKHTLLGKSEVQVQMVTNAVMTDMAPLDALLQNPGFAGQVTVRDVGEGEFALHYKDGRYCAFLAPGKYAFWNMYNKHEFVKIDSTVTEVGENVPKYIFDFISSRYYTEVIVPSYAVARLYLDGKFIRLLRPGTYFFWKNGTDVQADILDTRLIQLDISGQEMLTADKVTLRINFVANYKIRDFVKIAGIDNYREQIRLAARLALRRYVGKNKLDEILENKDGITEYVFAALKEREADLFVDFTDAGVKDIILPGEIRDIMNTVLIAEKRARANVITRREEVASTRSLLNTARLMDENRTLYRLKELEYVEKICENVGNITLNSGGDILTRLTGLLRKQ